MKWKQVQEEASGGGYKAWETDSVISVQDLNAVDKKLNFKVLFGGTIKKGIATVVDEVPTFTENGAAKASNTSSK